VANTVVGASSGSCILELTDPTGQKTSLAGTIKTSGSAFFCSFDAINGITKSGTWTAKLTAATNSGNGYQIMTFKKE
jgi:hypothetical protein